MLSSKRVVHIVRFARPDGVLEFTTTMGSISVYHELAPLSDGAVLRSSVFLGDESYTLDSLVGEPSELEDKLLEVHTKLRKALSVYKGLPAKEEFARLAVLYLLYHSTLPHSSILDLLPFSNTSVSLGMVNMVSMITGEHVSGSPSSIVKALYTRGLLSFDKRGYPYVVGVSVREALEDILSGVVRNKLVVENIHEDVVRTIMRFLNSGSGSEILRQLLTRPLLAELAILDPELRGLVSVETLSASTDRGTVWSALSPKVRRIYIAVSGVETLEKMVSPEYRSVFSDVEIEAYNKILNRDLVKGTELLYTHRRDSITETSKPQLWSDGRFKAIRMGEYLVLVNNVAGVGRSDEKTFLVFRETDRIGLPVPATTVESGITEAERRYDTYLAEVRRARRRGARIVVQRMVHGYKLYMPTHTTTRLTVRKSSGGVGRSRKLGNST